LTSSSSPPLAHSGPATAPSASIASSSAIRSAISVPSLSTITSHSYSCSSESGSFLITPIASSVHFRTAPLQQTRSFTQMKNCYFARYITSTSMHRAARGAPESCWTTEKGKWRRSRLDSMKCTPDASIASSPGAAYLWLIRQHTSERSPITAGKSFHCSSVSDTIAEPWETSPKRRPTAQSLQRPRGKSSEARIPINSKC
jgi:hypothetical protein